MGAMRLRFVWVLLLVLLGSLSFPSFLFAHPGSTSSDGCHFCRTNCAKWGWTSDTRHGHSGQSCDPAKGPIDPLYSGGGLNSNTESVAVPTQVVPTRAPTARPTRKPTLIPRTTSTSQPSPTTIIELSPTFEPTLTQEITPTIVETITPTAKPEVKGINTENPKSNSRFRWWMLTPLTSFLKVIFGWK